MMATFFGLPLLDKALICGPDDGVVADCDEGGHVQDVSDGRSSAGDHAMAAPCAGIAIEWRDTDEGCELSAVKAAQFRQFCDKGSCGDGTHTRHGGEDVFRLAPGGRGAHARVDVGVDFGEFFFEEGDMAVDLFDESLGGGAAAAIGLHADHLDDLSPPCDEFAARAGLRRGHRLDLRSNLFGE
jgi:hypothetical protein